MTIPKELADKIIDMVADGYPKTTYQSNDPEIQALMDETWRTMDHIWADAFYKGTRVRYTNDEEDS